MFFNLIVPLEFPIIFKPLNLSIVKEASIPILSLIFNLTAFKISEDDCPYNTLIIRGKMSYTCKRYFSSKLLYYIPFNFISNAVSSGHKTSLGLAPLDGPTIPAFSS